MSHGWSTDENLINLPNPCFIRVPSVAKFLLVHPWMALVRPKAMSKSLTAGTSMARSAKP